ncbi:MAG: nuclear transport factor 2 family protein [Chloroflexota bacterium]
MNLTQAKALVHRQAKAWEQADIETVIADFAEDGVFISPGGTWQGHKAIRKAMSDFFEQAKDVKIEILRVLVDGQQGAIEWRWREFRLTDSQYHSADDAIIFAVNAQNKIVYWREYFDTANF